MHDAGSTTSSCDTSSHTSDSSSHTSHTSHTSHSPGETWAGTQHLTLNSNDPGYYGNAKVPPGGSASRAEVTVLVAVILAIVILLIGLSLI
jgi:hypothetical protein